jgi:hypothetical protein
MGAQTGDWVDLQVVSSDAQLVGITAPGMANSSLIDSETTYENGTVLACSQITSINVKGGKVVAHKRTIL